MGCGVLYIWRCLKKNQRIWCIFTIEKKNWKSQLFRGRKRPFGTSWDKKVSLECSSMYYAAIGPVLCLFLVILYKILPNHIVKSSCRPDLFFHRDSYELCGPELGHLATAETYEGVPPPSLHRKTSSGSNCTGGNKQDCRPQKACCVWSGKDDFPDPIFDFRSFTFFPRKILKLDDPN